MSSHWPHWKKFTLKFQLMGEVYHKKCHQVTFLYMVQLDCFKWALWPHLKQQRVQLIGSDSFKCKIHLVRFLYIFLLIDCFKWSLIDHFEKWRVHSELCQFQMGGYIIRFTWWHFFISSYELTVSNELSLTALKSEEFTLSSGSFKCKIHLVTFLYIFLWVDYLKWALIDHKIHLVTFLYIFLLVDCFKWGLIDHKIHLVTFLYILLLVDCFKWALIDRIEKWRVHSELCCFKWGVISINGGYLPISWLFIIDHKIHLVTFLYIFLLVDCFKWALIDCIEKWRIHSELCRFQMGGYIVRFTWWHFLISSY